MRLLYYYGEIESLRDAAIKEEEEFKTIAINFSREYIFNVTENNLMLTSNSMEIEIKRFGEYIPSSFWTDDGKVYNCTIFIGNNGSGKTTILHNVMRGVIGGNFPIYDRSLFIWQDNDNLVFVIADADHRKSGSAKQECIEEYKVNNLFNNTNEAKVILVKKDLNEKSELREKYRKRLKKTKIIYFSNTFSRNDFLKGIRDSLYYSDFTISSMSEKMIENKSIVKQFNTIASEQGNDKYENVLQLYFDSIFEEQVRFVFSDRIKEIFTKAGDFKVVFPDYLKISIDPRIPHIHGIDKREANMNRLLEIGNTGIKLEPYNTEIIHLPYSSKDRKELFVYLIALSSLFKVCTISQNQNTYLKIINIIIEKINSKTENKKSIDCYQILQLIIRDIESNNSLSSDKTMIEALKDLIKYLYKEIDNISPLHQLIDDKSVITDYYNKPDGSADFGNLHFCINNVSCTININEGKFPTTRKSIFKLVELYNRMKKINIEPNIVFEWGMSSGEENVLSMLSSIYSISQKKSFIDIDTVLIFMDEADIGYHPEWQRKWFYVFPRMIEEILNNNAVRDIQFVMATHSPLLLGDIPSKCSYYIKKDSKGIEIDNNLKSNNGRIVGSFGQNLYTLLQNGFFLENSALGETALKKSELIVESFEIFRDIIGCLRYGSKAIAKNSEEGNVVLKVKRYNEKAENEFTKDYYDFTQDKYYQNRKIIIRINNQDMMIEYGAYWLYIYKLINLYTGFIKQKLMNEYEDITKQLEYYSNKKTSN